MVCMLWSFEYVVEQEKGRDKLRLPPHTCKCLGLLLHGSAEMTASERERVREKMGKDGKGERERNQRPAV